REAAFTSTGEMSVRDADQGATQRRVELSFAADLGGEPEVLRAAARLANSPHAPTVQREPIDVDNGFVAEIAGAEADARVQVEPIAARTDHGRAPPSLGATGEEPVERVSECIGISDRVAGRETGAVHVPVRDRSAPVCRDDVALVVTQRERVERVTVAAVDEASDGVPFGRRREC